MSAWDRVYESRASQSVRRQIASPEVPHAWLLLGPSGSGKRSAAMAMAAALCCEVEPGRGCGECSSCSRIARGRHPDVHHIAPEGPIIPVDLIRDSVIPEAARSPFESRRKVFIIEESERMNPFAQNALLKTLEEPQPDTVFVLISDREEELLDTIRSRCRVVRLDAVPEQQVIELLVKEGASEETATLAARLSDGDVELARRLALDEAAIARRWLFRGIPGRLRSPVDAFEAAAEVLAEAKDAVKAREQSQKAEIVALAEAMGEGRGTAGARNALAKRHKRELRRLEDGVLGDALRSLASFYRDVLATRSGGGDAIANLDLRDEIGSWAARAAEDAALVAAIERCVSARSALLRNANPQLTIEAALVELARLVPPPTAAEVAWRG
ncbi:MAG: DNA polymerase III subunit delta' [Actinomycetota bacterium]